MKSRCLRNIARRGITILSDDLKERITLAAHELDPYIEGTFGYLESRKKAYTNFLDGLNIGKKNRKTLNSLFNAFNQGIDHALDCTYAVGKCVGTIATIAEIQQHEEPQMNLEVQEKFDEVPEQEEPIEFPPSDEPSEFNIRDIRTLLNRPQ